MNLTDLNTLGLPGWLIITAAIIFILKQVGLLDFMLKRMQLSRELEQSEQVALWTQMTQLQTKALEQNELLLEYIINTSVDWHKNHSDKLGEAIENQRAVSFEMKQLVAKCGIIVDILEDRYGKKEGR
jgi:hypothetical protein